MKLNIQEQVIRFSLWKWKDIQVHSVMVCFANVVHYFDRYDSEMTHIQFFREGIISVLIMSLHKEHPLTTDMEFYVLENSFYFHRVHVVDPSR